MDKSYRSLSVSEKHPQIFEELLKVIVSRNGWTNPFGQLQLDVSRGKSKVNDPVAAREKTKNESPRIAQQKCTEIVSMSNNASYSLIDGTRRLLAIPRIARQRLRAYREKIRISYSSLFFCVLLLTLHALLRPNITFLI